jgi:hypothetical protein
MTPWGSPARLRELQIQALRDALGDAVTVVDGVVTVDGESVEGDLDPALALEFDERPEDVVPRVLISVERGWEPEGHAEPEAN